VALGLRQSELVDDAVYVLLDGADGEDERARDSRVRAALGHELEHLALACGERLERLRATVPDQLRHDLGIKCGSAGADPSYGIDEVGDVEHAVLEQIADAPEI